MSEVILWGVTGLSIAGTVLNIRRVRFCFILWGTTNLFWVVRNFSIGETQQAELFLVYLGLSIWGWFSWSSRESANRNPA